MPPAHVHAGATVARNALYLVIGQGATTVLEIVFSAALARSLGAQEFGTYYLISTMSAFAYVFVEWGQPLFVIEVMKMFNKVLAPFSGTLVKNLMRDMDGHVVKKGQVIFRIEPDERVSTESEESVAARRRATTLSLLG